MALVAKPIDFHELFLSTNVAYFCQHVLGAEYDAIKGLIYPEPRYRSFILAKRSGSFRVIHEPRWQLKSLQLKLLEFIKLRAEDPKPCVHGFVNDRSIVTNARQHLAQAPHHLLNLDLEDFFPSINFFRVRGVFRKAPFNLGHEVATVLAQLCCYRNELPQGAPTSPAISNLVCRSLDRDLTQLAKRHRATYTRYADDMTFSFSVRNASRLPINICAFDSGSVALGHELQTIIQDQHHFKVNSAKTRVSTRLSRMEVTGIKINEFPNVKREFIDTIRGALHAWDRYGYDKAQSAWSDLAAGSSIDAGRQKPRKRQTRTGKLPSLKRVVWGKLLYVRMVRGANDPLYTRLAEKFNNLVEKERKSKGNFGSPLLPINPIVRDQNDAERAVYFVEWVGDYQPPGVANSEVVFGQGTAFAFNNSRDLITCDHVLRWSGLIHGVEVEVDVTDPALTLDSVKVFNPTSKVEIAVDVIARDQHRDLALLRARESVLPRYFTALESPVNQNEQALLIGYPNWTPGRTASHDDAKVTNRYPRSALACFEVNKIIRQGNSGGPVLDLQYRVAGIAQKGATQQQGNNECLCIGEMIVWLKSLS